MKPTLRGDQFREATEELAVLAAALGGRLAANARWLDSFEAIHMRIQLSDLRDELVSLVNAQPVLPRRRMEVV